MGARIELRDTKNTCNYKRNFALFLISILAFDFISTFLYIPRVQGTSFMRFRLGATVPISAIAGFGKLHGVSIGLSYQGGVNFYNYMTKNPGFFSHIDIAVRCLDFWGWGGEKEFLRGLLDSADADSGRSEISISLYGVDLGWPGFWEAKLLELLEAIGPNRRSMRFIWLKGEWTYKDMTPPGFDDLKADFLRAREIVASYGYQLGWFGEGKYLTNIPKDKYSELYSWGPRTRTGQVSRSSDPIKGAQDCYNTANWWERPNDVLLAALTMWDREANVPGASPYYIYYEKFEAFIKGASDRFDASNGQYPQSVLFYVMPETFNDVAGVNCPYLEWWAELAEKYGLRTSRSEPMPVPRPPDVKPPASPFPPYPVLLKIGNSGDQNLPPFMVQTGGEFKIYLNAKNAHTWGALANRPVEIYLAKRTLKPNSLWDSYPLTREELSNVLFLGTVTTGSNGWASGVTLKAPSEPGKYTLVAHVPKTDLELEAYSDFTEFILVTPKVHRVEVRSNVKMKLAFGPSAYGPPWQNVDSERWVEPNKPLWGYGGEMNWTFIVPSQVTDGSGRIWKFSRWEDGNTNPKRTIFVGEDLVLEARYSEPGTGDSRMPSSVSCSVSTSELFKGEAVIISGSIFPPISGATITLSYIRPDGSSFTRSLTTSSSGSYSDNYSPNNLGTYYVQASWLGDENYKGSSSPWVSFNVKRRPSSMELSISSTSISPGDSLGISGTLSPAVSGAKVAISYRFERGNWIPLTNLTSDSNGWFSCTLTNTPTEAGVYEVKGSWPGNDDYEGSSFAVSFSVVDLVNSSEPDFSISVDKPYLTLVIGEPEQSITVMLRSKQGFSSEVSLSLSGIPRGVVARLSPNKIVVSSDDLVYSTIRLHAKWNSSPGSYVLRLVASDGEKEHANDIKLKVMLPTPQFSVSVNPRVLAIPRLSGYNATATVEVSSLSNYTIEPLLKVIGVPEGVKIKLDEETLALPRLGSGSTKLTIINSANPLSQGNYSVLIECRYKDVVLNEKITLVVIDIKSTSLRADLTSTYVQFGDELLLNASISPPHKGEIVVLLKFKNGSEVNLATLETDEFGKFSYSIPIYLAEGEYEARLVYEPNTFYSGSTLNLSFRVERASVIVTLSSNTTKAGLDEPVLLNGTVKTFKGRPISNVDVRILVVGEKEVKSFSAKTDENGKYSLILKGLRQGEYNATSFVNDSKFYKPAVSGQIRLEIYDQALSAISGSSIHVIMLLALINLIMAVASILRKS